MTEYDTKDYKSNVLNGERCGSAKITDAQALKIIHLLESSPKSIAQISRDEHISSDIVYDINCCRTWTFLHSYSKNIRKEFREKNKDE